MNPRSSAMKRKSSFSKQLIYLLVVGAAALMTFGLFSGAGAAKGGVVSSVQSQAASPLSRQAVYITIDGKAYTCWTKEIPACLQVKVGSKVKIHYRDEDIKKVIFDIRLQ